MSCVTNLKWFTVWLLIAKTVLLRTNQNSRRLHFSLSLKKIPYGSAGSIRLDERIGSLQNRRSCAQNTSRTPVLCRINYLVVLESIGWTATRLRLKQDAVPTVFYYSCTETEAKRKHQPMRAAVAKRRRLEVSCLFTF